MAVTLFYIVLVLLIIYSGFILLYKYLWGKLKPFVLNEGSGKAGQNSSRFSIIIPARNEADNIQTCLLSILEGSYPGNLYDITVVDDFSTDATVENIGALQRQFPGQIKVIELKTLLDSRPINSYKKKALSLAIGQASGDWIVTTDADCQVPKDWLNCFDGYIRQTAKRFIAAPVRFTDTGSFVSKFQCLDFLSLQDRKSVV